MEQWHVAALLATLTAVGGGLRWFFGWLDRRAETRHKRALELEEAKANHALAIEKARLEVATKLEALAKTFLEVNERHRNEHLADTKLFATTVAALKRSKSEPPSSP